MSRSDATPVKQLRTGSTSQGLLATLLGDYWFGSTVYIPSAALVALLAEFEISEQAARAALSRVQRAGHLEGSKHGRNTAYRLPPEGAEQALVSGRRIMAFTRETPATASPWNGRWSLIAYSFPSEQADGRRQVRARLRSLGFAPIQDAVWICPHRRAAKALHVLNRLGVSGVTVFEDAEAIESSALEVEQAWNLDRVRARYDMATVVFSAIEDRIGERSLSPTEALVARTEAMDAWRPIGAIDPRLPVELLPADWPRWEASRRFAGIYGQLGETAAARVREIVESHSSEAAAAVRFDSVERPR